MQMIIRIIKPYVVAQESTIYQINHMPQHDLLTHLPNRCLLSECLEKQTSCLVRYNLYGVLLFIDLDGFKFINENFGHDAGDAILIEGANHLK